MNTKKKMKDYSLFTLIAKERFFNKENNTMYLLVRPNSLTIQSNKNNVLFTNLNTLEICVDLATMKVTSNLINILFMNASTGTLIKFNSTLDLNELKDFATYLVIESNRVSTRLSVEPFSKVAEDELLEVVSQLESINTDRLIDQALEERNEELFNLAISLKDKKNRPELTA